MTIPAAPNSVSFSDIQTEMGGSNPISLSEYYAGGGLTKSNIGGFAPNGIPTSGTISVEDFRGAQNIGETHVSTVTIGNSNIAGTEYFGVNSFFSTGSVTNSPYTMGSQAPSFGIGIIAFLRVHGKGGSTTDSFQVTGSASPAQPVSNSDTTLFKTVTYGSMTLTRSQATYTAPTGSFAPTSPSTSWSVEWASSAPGFSMDTSTSGTRTATFDCI